jgi:hypothetical protein
MLVKFFNLHGKGNLPRDHTITQVNAGKDNSGANPRPGRMRLILLLLMILPTDVFIASLVMFKSISEPVRGYASLTNG